MRWIYWPDIVQQIQMRKKKNKYNLIELNRNDVNRLAIKQGEFIRIGFLIGLKTCRMIKHETNFPKTESNKQRTIISNSFEVDFCAFDHNCGKKKNIKFSSIWLRSMCHRAWVNYSTAIHTISFQ